MTRGNNDAEKPADWLRPRDRRSVAMLTLGGLFLSAAYWWAHGGNRGQLVDIDRAPPLHAQFQVDVNQAEWAELILLPGVGPTLAQRLIDDRRERGEFLSVDELMRIRGIGQRTLQRIRPYVLPISGEHDVAQR